MDPRGASAPHPGRVTERSLYTGADPRTPRCRSFIRPGMAGFLIFHRGRDTGRIRTVRVSGPLRRRAAERQGRVRQRIRREGSGTGNATADFRNTASGEHPAEGAPLPHAAAAREKGAAVLQPQPRIRQNADRPITCPAASSRSAHASRACVRGSAHRAPWDPPCRPSKGCCRGTRSQPPG